jgi:hypothetical protein
LEEKGNNYTNFINEMRIVGKIIGHLCLSGRVGMNLYFFRRGALSFAFDFPNLDSPNFIFSETVIVAAISCFLFVLFGRSLSFSFSLF